MFKLMFTVLLVISKITIAAENDHFQTISLDQGLSQSRVTAVIQDSEGYMWFGTQIGLNRYDGYKIVSFYHDSKNENSLPGNSISTLLIDSANNLWIGTSHTGIANYNTQTGIINRFVNKDSDQNSQKNMIFSMTEDKEQNLWIGTGSGIFIFDILKQNFFKASQIHPELRIYNNRIIRSLYFEQTGNIWIGADDMELDLFNIKKSVLSHAILPSPELNNTEQNRYNSIKPISPTQIAVASNNGVWMQLNNSLSFKSIPVDIQSEITSGFSINDLLLDQNNELWIASENGLFTTDSSENSTMRIIPKLINKEKMKSNSLQTLFESKDGVIWIGTAGGGVSKLNRRNWFKLYTENIYSNYPLSTKSVWSITEDQQNNIWVGTKNGGLNKLDFINKKITYFNHDSTVRNSLSHNTVRSLVSDIDGGLWIGTDKGVNYLTAEGDEFIHYLHDKSNTNSISSNLVRPMIQTKDGMIWVGTNGAGLNQMDPNSPGIFESFRFQEDNNNSIPSDDVYQLYEDQQSRLWIATLGGGLSYFDRVNNRFTNFRNKPNHPQSISSNNVLSIVQDNKGYIWVGTTNGLNKLEDIDLGIFTRTHMDRNSIGNVVYGLLTGEDGHLWLSTNKGLSHYDPNTNLFRNFDVHDGLQSNEFNGGAYYKSSQGTFYFGGIEGLNSFKLTQFNKKHLLPPTKITKFEIKTATSESEQINLPESAITFLRPDGVYEFEHNTSSISIEFSALDFISPTKIKYKYRMLGFENNWNHVSSDDRTAKYTNLNSGNYTFQVTASNNIDIWEAKPTQLYIFIKPPFWEKNWFIILILATSALLLFSFIKLRMRAIENRNKNLKHLVNSKSQKIINFEKQKIIQKERQRINRDLHDSMGGQLISTIIQLRQGNFDKNEVIDQIQNSLKDLKYIMDSMDQTELKLSTIIQFILEKFESKIEQLNMMIDVHASEKDLEHIFSPEKAVHIQHILQEAIVNAIRHSKATKITLFADVTNDNTLNIIIEDNGSGINESYEPGRGLLNMKYRINKISGEMQILTRPDFDGTQLLFNVHLTSKTIP